MTSLSTENLDAAGSRCTGPARHSLSRVRRYAARELEYAQMGAPGLAGLEVDDLLDDVLVEAWGRVPPRSDGLPAWIVARLHARIDDAIRAAEVSEDAHETVFVDDWIRDNTIFWTADGPPDDEAVADSGLDPYELASLVEHISPAERRALLLHSVEGLGPELIAEALGVSEREARALVERATERLLRARQGSDD